MEAFVLGSEYWPQTVEGRVLCLLLAFYAFGVFGYACGHTIDLLHGARSHE